jgi:hypothetical protein
VVTKLTNWQHEKSPSRERGARLGLVQHTTKKQAEREGNCLHLYITTAAMLYVGINQKLLVFLSAKLGGFARKWIILILGIGHQKYTWRGFLSTGLE